MPIALVDVDGVLADTTQHIMDMVAPGMKKEEARTFEVESYLTPEQAQQARALMNTPEFWLTLPVMPGSDRGMQVIRDRGYEVVILTRGYRPPDSWLACREDWLEENFDIHHNDIICAARKDLVQGRVFIDDRLENIEKWENRNHGEGFAWLMDAPYNQDIVRTQRITWDTIELAL